MLGKIDFSFISDRSPLTVKGLEDRLDALWALPPDLAVLDQAVAWLEFKLGRVRATKPREHLSSVLDSVTAKRAAVAAALAKDSNDADEHGRAASLNHKPEAVDAFVDRVMEEASAGGRRFYEPDLLRTELAIALSLTQDLDTAAADRLLGGVVRRLVIPDRCGLAVTAASSNNPAALTRPPG